VIDVEPIRASGMAVECSGGAGPGPELLLERLGCQGPAPPDVTLRLDADGDRLQLVDEHGTPLDAELTLPLVLLALDARSIVKGADTSRLVDAVAASRGGSVRVVPAGEIHLVEALLGGGDLAGEGNGGAIVPSVGLARDGLAAAAAILALLARRGVRVSTLAAELPRLARRRSTAHCPDPARARTALQHLARHLGIEAADPHTGVQVEVDDGQWGLVRLSATEPVLRVMAEAPTQAEADSLHSKLRSALLAGEHSP
jgi:phosphomannomutase